MKISSEEPRIECRGVLKSWKGKLIQLELKGQREHKLGVLEGFDICGALLGPKKGLNSSMGFYEWKDIINVNYVKETD